MKLNNYTRDAFVRAVMNDVPKQTIEPLKVQEIFFKAMPPKIRTIAKDKDLSKHIIRDSLFIVDRSYHGIITAGLNKEEVLKDIYDREKARNQLQIKIRNVAYGCSSLKRLQEALPELVKYMPSETTAQTVNLPMIVGVMSDLNKLGFKPSLK